MAKQRITLYIDEGIWKMFRQLCVLDGTSASAKAEHLMMFEVYDTNLPEINRFGSNDSQNDSHEVKTPKGKR